MEKEIWRVSEFPDDLLLKILSYLPSSKDVVATSVLSKRWRSLWKEVKTFKYVFGSKHPYWEFMLFIRRRSKVESLELRLDPNFMAPIIRHLFNTCVGSSLRELRIELLYNSIEFPEIFYISSQIETLILEKLSLEDVPSNVSLICLKRLHLLSVKFQGDHSVETLLSICPRLEDLVVRRSSYTNVIIFTIHVPTLRSLSIHNSSRHKGTHGFVINAPSLRSFSISDSFSNYLLFANMPELVKASVNIVCDQPNNFFGSLASTKYLSLCYVTSQSPYPPTVTSFHFLDHLELCTCSAKWWNILTIILSDAMRLRVLKLKLLHKHCVQYNDAMDTWSQPSFVPECLSSHLEIVEWKQFKGRKLEREIAKYILENASHLKKATFYSESKEEDGMLKELECVTRGSKTCQFLFE